MFLTNKITKRRAVFLLPFMALLSVSCSEFLYTSAQPSEPAPPPQPKLGYTTDCVDAGTATIPISERVDNNLLWDDVVSLLYRRFEIEGGKNEQHYRGNTVFCPCCGKSFNSFMNYSNIKDSDSEHYINTYKNTICPYCQSLPRHRIICYYLEKNKPTVPRNNILMFGAEFSIKKWFNINDCHYRTADLFNKVSDMKVDIQNTHFSDERWELIICNHVLEYAPDYKIALKELKRILNKNGFLEITVPTDRNSTTVYEDSSNNHLRIFGNDFEKILTEIGFLVEIVDGGTIRSDISGVIGPADYDDNRVYICRKR
jgi:SAM-dependent methyltransferase